jgi:hypothetical protein
MAGGDWSTANGIGVVGGVGAGGITQAGIINAPVTVSTSDVTINLPIGSWRYVKVLVVTADLVVATAVNEAASIGTAGTPPTPSWGVGDIDIGASVEMKPITKANGAPLVGGTDVIHVRASGAGTVYLVPVK